MPLARGRVAQRLRIGVDEIDDARIPGHEPLPAAAQLEPELDEPARRERLRRAHHEDAWRRVRDNHSRDRLERGATNRVLVGTRRIEDPDPDLRRPRGGEERDDGDAGVVVDELERRNPELQVAVEQARRPAEVERAEVAGRILRAGRPEEDGATALLPDDRGDPTELEAAELPLARKHDTRLERHQPGDEHAEDEPARPPGPAPPPSRSRSRRAAGTTAAPAACSGRRRAPRAPSSARR